MGICVSRLTMYTASLGAKNLQPKTETSISCFKQNLASNGFCLWEFPQILLCERWKFFKTISCCHHVLLDRITGVQANAQRSRLFTVPHCRSCKFCAHQPCVTCSNLMIFKLSYQLPTTLYTTVDGRSPAPPGMYKTFYIVGKTTNLNWCRISEPSTVLL